MTLNFEVISFEPEKMEMESGARFLAFSIFSVRNVTGQINVLVKQGEVYLHKYSRTKISPRFMESTFSISLQILLNNVTSMCFFSFQSEVLFRRYYSICWLFRKCKCE